MERADADERLERERVDAEHRLRDEREFAEALRVRERQAECAAWLLVQIDDLQAAASDVMGVLTLPPGRPDLDAARGVLRNLQRSAHTSAVLLGDTETQGRFRTLVQLAFAAGQDDREESEMDEDSYELLRARTGGDLRNYAIFVRLSLWALIDGEPIPDPGYPQYPNLNRVADHVPWHPTNVPQGWDEAVQTDPGHPRFRKIEPPPHL